MAHLSYHNYKGYGEVAKENYWYSQAVRVGDKIECSGQGGWDPQTQEIPDDVCEQIDKAFANIELTLKTAGGKGWSEVYQVRSYHAPYTDEALGRMVENLKKYCPGHQPIFTVIGVPRLALEAMKVEIEVTAHVPN